MAAVMAQDITPALSPAPYDWLATTWRITMLLSTSDNLLRRIQLEAAAGTQMRNCADTCAEVQPGASGRVVVLCKAAEGGLTCVKCRSHPQKKVPAQIEELQKAQIQHQAHPTVLQLSHLNTPIGRSRAWSGSLKSTLLDQSSFDAHCKADGSSCQGIGP